MVEQPRVSAPEISTEALQDFRQELERYGVVHERCRNASLGDERHLMGLLDTAEQTLRASAGRFARLEQTRGAG
jgi:hypothetical protein